MATNENSDDIPPIGGGDLTVPDLRTMEELCQPTLNGRGRPISPIAIQATNFGLKNDMIQQVQNCWQFHELSGDDANKHLDKFLHVTQSIKVNGVTDDALRLYLFSHSLTHHATAWFDSFPRNSINTFKQMAKMCLGKYFPPSMVTKLRNEITNFRQRPDRSLFKVWERYKLSIDHCPNHNMLPVTQIDTFYNGLTLRHRDTINAAAGGTFMKRRPEECYDPIENMTAHHNDCDTSVQKENLFPPLDNPELTIRRSHVDPTLLNDFEMDTDGNGDPPVPDLRTMEELCQPTLNGRGGTFMKMRPEECYDLIKNMTAHHNDWDTSVQRIERETEVTKDKVPPSNNESTKDVQPSVVHFENEIPNSEPVVALVVKPVEAPVSAPKPNQKSSIPYLFRLHDQKLRAKANDQKEKFFKIFQDLDFNISFTDALILMPKFGLTIKSLLTNKEKLFELARTPLNEHCSTVLLKKLPEKPGGPRKFLIPCGFLGMDKCLALADLGASINLMPLS
nr:reverse transcriptase domain-containing protein [Tanacetum cinerariifolium]